MTHDVTSQFFPQHVDTEIRFVGLQRSGNHAIINWILSQASKPFAFFNNAWPNHPFLDPPDQGSTGETEYRLVLISFEDRPLPLLASRWTYPHNVTTTPWTVSRRIDLLLLRDPFNLFASRRRSNTVETGSSHYLSGLSMPQLYLSYLREAEGETNFLQHDRIVVSYNRWIDSQAYRKELAQRIGFKFTDAGIGEVSQHGGGSSFEGTSACGQGHMMKTTERWRYFQNERDFRRMFRNSEMLDRAMRLFNLDEDLKTWIRDSLRPQCSGISSLKDDIAVALVPRILTMLRGIAYKTSRASFKRL